MRSMVLDTVNAPLVLRDVSMPSPNAHEVLIKVAACGVCRTELDQVEGRIAPPKLPVIPGHQPVGTVTAVGQGVTRFAIGDRAGAMWIFSACGTCEFCERGEENLCLHFKATGCHANGGYAAYMVISERYALALPDGLGELSRIAPFMCAGAVGYRSLRLATLGGDMTLGLFGFGSANHLVLQTAKVLRPNTRVGVFTRNLEERQLALELGAAWVGNIDGIPPWPLDRAIDTTPAWRPVLSALERLRPGGILVINAIRKEVRDHQDLLRLDYSRHLWMERQVRTVANVTRRDGEEFLDLAASHPIHASVQEYRLEQANDALADIRDGRIRGSKVLVIDE